MKAVLRQTRISPKKANLVAGMVRGKRANEALEFLRFLPKKAAKVLVKVIHSAVKNAENDFSQDAENLYLAELIVNEGPTYRRSIPKARGRVAPILKRTSHIFVRLAPKSITDKPDTALKSQSSKEAKTSKVAAS
jgi:large subunit ribosomal protein L22